MVSTTTIPRLEVAEKPVETNIPLNKCSRIPTHRHDGAFPSLVEMRRQYDVSVYETVSHIRQLCALEEGI